MWILLRLAAFTVAFLVRLFYRFSPPKVAGVSNGTSYFVKLKKNKSTITGFEIGVPLKNSILFSLHSESFWDRACKILGIATEYQTGDKVFDEKIYVACDHPQFLTLLRDQEQTRTAIVSALDFGAHRLRSDGLVFWMSVQARREPTTREIEQCIKLGTLFSELESHLTSRFSDPFFWRALIIESLIWSIFAYSIGGYTEYLFHNEDYHVNPMDLAKKGIYMGFGLLIFVFTLIVVILRGSSRGHRLLIESAILLVLGAAGAGVQLASDLNRSLDSAQPTETSRSILRTEKRVHRGRRGRVSYSYHFHLQDEYKRSIQVSPDLYAQAVAGSTLKMSIGPGWLGEPWHRNLEVIR